MTKIIGGTLMEDNERPVNAEIARCALMILMEASAARKNETCQEI
jgi:hypothetical protein